MKIEIKNIPEYQVAFILKKGSYQQIPDTLGKVVGWLMVKNVEIQMPVYGLYYNSPVDVSEEELEWEVGAAFVGELEGEADIKIKTVPSHEAVRTVFKGPYGDAASVYMDLIQYAANEGYQITGPVLESYLNDPSEVSQSEALTEIQFPVVKK
ncbi:GyrI-like domain-containing protein [Methanobacterium formicicum]|uniref:Transcriptional activator ligand binding domain-containing protein n=1 Tax=Methanobacterium formicicum (strain DSM 3637 / PP1) TaxID=1204725 RepID=K2RD02_METFP|nr:GyrI-like domain-containing protein [Methanobacterium formicicum]EKF86219.1 transcriptional activator ligand binding domain-containing protein [Methanobacterium formicicum DSM 3637]